MVLLLASVAHYSMCALCFPSLLAVTSLVPSTDAEDTHSVLTSSVEHVPVAVCVSGLTESEASAPQELPLPVNDELIDVSE